MKVDEKILERFESLIEFGEKVLSTRHEQSDVIGPDLVDSQQAHQWATSTQNLLARVMGQDSEHYKNFTKRVDKHLTYSPVNSAQGILKAAKDDYEHEQLFKIRQLVEAEVFDDFLEQAEHLFKSGYYQPAAVICGCVLEDGLRKLCERNGIDIGSKPKLDKMNADLAKAGIYTKLVQKKITHLAELRNKAAHGQWDQFHKNDVEEMLSAARRIMEEYFA
ncbi:MAG: HEPN domain-containing protein [bacterium]|nr:HEPN domain-containing protein [bacterium]